MLVLSRKACKWSVKCFGSVLLSNNKLTDQVEEGKPRNEFEVELAEKLPIL